MRMVRLFLCVGLSVFGFFSTATIGNADTMFDVETTQVGGFFETGVPDNDAVFQNYFVGRSTPAGASSPLPERRSFFIFDIPTFGPGEVLTDATFSIYLPSDFSVPANFTGGFEIFKITSAAHSADVILDPLGAGVPVEEIFDGFGTGSFYGDLVFEESDPPTGPFPLEMVIPLSPDALADISASEGGSFVISGIMETYDPAPDAASEIIFSLSDLVVGGTETSLPKPFLSLTTTSIPEPGLGILGLILLSGLGFRRSR